MPTATARQMTRLVAGILLLCCTFAPAPAAAGEKVAVELESGRVVIGEVDARTSTRLLWLRLSSGSMTMLRPVEWERVERAVIGNEDLDAAAFRAKALQIRSFAPPADESDSPLEGVRSPAAPEPEQIAPPPGPAWFIVPGQVRSIWADAELGHWDSDAAADGLLLQLVALDCSGQPIPAEGSLEVELWTSDAGQRRLIGRWTCWLGPLDFGPSGAAQRLPFQADHPEFDHRLSRYGLVHVRFSSPGNGTFAYSVSDVRIRPPSTLRDERQTRGQGRHLPRE